MLAPAASYRDQIVPGPARVRATASAAPAERAAAVLTFLKNNGRLKGEIIAAEFGIDTATLRPVLKQLAADGAIRSEGKGRGTVYVAAGKRAMAAVN